MVERELSTHFAALRALARDLVGEVDADDLAQETLLQALRRPPTGHGPLLAWLRVVVRRLATRHRLARRRRQRREQAVARDEAVPAPQQQVEHKEQLQRLTAAVLGMAEPYQRTVLLRYLEELSPTQIAARDGVPIATVKSRLQRGLGMLRERLDADGEGGEWRAALTATFGLGKTAAVAAGVVLMGTAIKLALGGAAAAAAVAAWLWMQAAPVAAPTQSIVQRDAPSPAVADRDADPTTAAAMVSPADRREVATPPPAATAFLATVRGRCVDEDGKPVAGITVRLTGSMRADGGASIAPPIDWRDPAESVTHDDGRFEIRFAPSPLFSFVLTVGSHAPDHGRLGGYRRLGRLDGGQIVDLGDVPVLAPLHARTRVRDTNGEPLGRGDVQIQWTPPQGLCSPLEFSVGGVQRTDLAGTCTWARLLPGNYRVTVRDREVVSGGEFTLVRGQDDTLHDIGVAAISDTDVISGIVEDDRGVPLPQVSVFGRVGEQDRSESTSTDKAGAFRFVRKAGDGAERVRFSIVEDGFEMLDQTEGCAWGSTDVRLVLRRGASIEVLAVTEDGRPVDDYRLWVVPDAIHFTSWSCHDTDLRGEGVHRDGIAKITALPRGPYFVIVQPADAALAISRPVPVEATDTPARAIVRLQPAPLRAIRVQFADGQPVINSRIQLIDAAGTSPCVPGNAVPMPPWAMYTGNGTRTSQQPLPILLQETFTDARGEATLRGCDDHPVTVTVQGPTHCPAQVDNVHLTDTDPLLITVASGATLAGTTQPEVVRALRELAGLPAVGAVSDPAARNLPALNLQRGDASYPETFPAPGQFVHFDADGGFTLEHAPPGTWPLVLHTWIDSQQRTEVVANVELRDGETTTLQLDLSALLPGELSGRVLWNGRPLATSKVSVCATTTDLAGKPFEYWSQVQTDADGRFTWRGRAGTLQLVKTMLLRAEESIVMPAGGKVERDFHGSSGSLRIRIVDDARKPKAKLSVALIDPTGRCCEAVPPTDDDGSSQVEIAPGAYRVETLPARLLDQQAAAQYLRAHPPNTDDAFAGARIHLGDVTVTAGQTTEITLHLPPEWSR